MYLLTRGFSIVLLLASFVAAQTPESPKPPAPQKDAVSPRDLPRRVRISSSAAERALLKKVEPKYPATEARISGAVVLHIILSKAGDVQSIELVSGHPMLVPPIMDAVRQWKYKPFLLNGDPVEVDTTVQVEVKINTTQ